MIKQTPTAGRLIAMGAFALSCAGLLLFLFPFLFVPAVSGSTAVSVYFSANGLNPCVAHRLVSSATQPPSPDGRSYYVDTYILWSAPIAASRAVKQVSVVVRNGTTATILASQVSTFDCSTGNPVGAAPCL